MTFIDRTYPDVVRDLLTTLTQGVAAESHRITYDPTARPVAIEDVVLNRRPVSRVSYVRGFISDPGAPQPLPYVFSLNDYELVGTADDPNGSSAIRFLPFGRKPAPGTDIVVNYYPRSTDPTVLTDVNVGSIVRTLIETVAKELAVVYEQLNAAYDSAFVETATGVSLERVVRLLDMSRYRAGRPVGSVRFARRPGSVGEISIPAGTPLSDIEDTVRYETSEARIMLANESTAEVRVRGGTDDTPVVSEGTLRVVQRAIAGIETVTNERPTTTASEDESDAELRARARGALLRSNKGTVGAIEAGLMALPDVRAVKVAEFPNGVPGEIAVTISLTNPGPIPRGVVARLEELRPAGVRLLPPGTAGITEVHVGVSLVLAGSHVTPATIEQIRRGAREGIVDRVRRTGVGERIRVGPLVATILADERIVDAAVRIGAKGTSGGVPGEDFEPGGGTTVSIAPEDVVFDPEQFEQELPSGRPELTVTVVASFRATLLSGTTLEQVRGQLTQRLTSYFAALAPGAVVSAETLLTTLRDDTRYGLDPLSLRVQLQTSEQFVDVTQGGPSFTVMPGHSFTVQLVEVEA